MAEPAPTRNPATPASSASRTPASSAAASSASAPASSASASASSAPASASSSLSAAAPSSSARSSSSSAAQAQSSSSASPSSTSAPSSTAASSASSVISSSASSASRSTSVTIASAAASNSTSSSSGLSGGAIGGIVGGVVGGLVVIGLFWMWMRRRKDKRNRVPPPPPRDFREMTFNGSNRPRMGSNNMMSQSHRASSYSTLIQQGRPSSQYPSAPRSPSYYTTYPVATPSTLPDSPPMPASTNGESPPLSSGINTPAMRPVLAPLDTGLSRDNSSSSGEREFGVLPKHKSSVDRLRLEGSERAPSPASTSGMQPNSDGDPSSRATSPHPSMYGYSSPVAYPRASLSPENGARYPRPPSMASLSSHSQGRYRKPIGAPHAGRTVALEMPKPLGARPDASGDFFWQTPKVQPQGFDVGFEGHQRRMSRAATELDFHSLPSHGHSRAPSTHSTTTASKLRTPSHSILSGERQPSHSRSMNSMRGGQH